MISVTCPRCGQESPGPIEVCPCGHSFGPPESRTVPDYVPETPGSDRLTFPDAPAEVVPLAEQIVPEMAALEPVPASEGAPAPALPAMRSGWLRAHRWPLAAIGLVIALLAAGFYGWMTNAELTKANGSLRAAWADLDSTRTDLSATRSDLSTTRTSLTAEQAARQAADQQVTQLQGQVAAQSACISALQNDAADLVALAADEDAHFNATAKGSAISAANAAIATAYNAAISDYYNAYSAAFDGLYSTANSWISKGNAQIRAAGAAIDRYNAEVSKIDAGTAALDQREIGLIQQISQTQTTCGFGGTTPTT
jgi:hypothetical protein